MQYAVSTIALCGIARPDVLVYGSSPAGIAAAIVAGRQGLSVALYEPLKMLGGMGAAGNLGLNDGGLEAERTGLAREFALRNGKHYYPDEQVREVPHPECTFLATLPCQPTPHRITTSRHITAQRSAAQHSTAQHYLYQARPPLRALELPLSHHPLDPPCQPL
jgi:2-polyprenyl-6-methoxyphenol hydroxylase-like FAD-dependent oxidoreductase